MKIWDVVFRNPETGERERGWNVTAPGPDSAVGRALELLAKSAPGYYNRGPYDGPTNGPLYRFGIGIEGADDAVVWIAETDALTVNIDARGTVADDFEPATPLTRAAPAMLAALERVADHLGRMEGGKWLRNAAGTEALAAIAAAKGAPTNV